MEKRLLTRAEAAAYCGYSLGQFSRLISAGRLSPTIPGMARWNMAAIDAWLDKASGIDRSTAKTPQQLSDEAFDAWEREDAARQAARKSK